ncbi:toll/interleukin-1 receptor domain-containing protein [Frankia sp. Cj3]|uniref:toll/interleukin-1 receptor domain-containing protein n=1 Tax=Frankia sp. Cj3 TaxID=2880976 RepID=UPI001EF42271|nr:TIR domain-containing protein [Frankia sp. Cj3]
MLIHSVALVHPGGTMLGRADDAQRWPLRATPPMSVPLPVVASWHFFISYTAADMPWAEWIAWQLERAGYRVLFQKWDFVPGTHWTARMEEGIRGARHTLAILSAAYLESGWGRAEWEAAHLADQSGTERKLIPVRVEDCPRPGLLGRVVYFDIFGLTADDARERLLAGVTAAMSGRGKPASEPDFPGPILLPADRAGPVPPPYPFPGSPDSAPGGALDSTRQPPEPRARPVPASPAAENGPATGREPVRPLAGIVADGGPTKVGVLRHASPSAGGRLSPVLVVAFSSDSRRLVTGGRDGAVRCWEVDSLRCQGTFVHPAPVRHAVFSPDDSLLATVCLDGNSRLWDVSAARVTHLWASGQTPPALLFGPAGRYLLSCFPQAAAWRHDLGVDRGVDRGIALAGSRLGAEGEAFVAASPDGRFIALRDTRSERLVMRHSASGEIRKTVETVRRVTAARFSWDGGWLVTLDDSCSPRLWALATGACVYPSAAGKDAGDFTAAGSEVVDAALGLAGQLLVLRHRSMVISFIDVAACRVRARFSHPRTPGALTVSRDGRFMAAHSPAYRVVFVYDLSAGPARHRSVHEPRVNAVAFSPDGRWFATASDAGEAALWRLPNPSTSPSATHPVDDAEPFHP